MVGHRIRTLTHHQNGLSDKFLHISEAFTDYSLELVTFSTMSQGRQRGPIMPLIST